MARQGYRHAEIEAKAQEKWASLGLYVTDLEKAKNPYYLLNEFPYPSGDLHIGHWYAFAITDIFARYKRMTGADVLYPIGFDAFGLPAENAAMKHGKDPREWTNANMERMREQLRSMGASFDWSKEVVTCDPEYYRFTQWLFSKLYEQDLAYRAEAAVKWCPVDQTVLANEQVIDGHCERCGSAVEEKRLTQWFLRITSYAERLIEDLDVLPWREDIKDAQRAWIGKSEGARLTFPLSSGDAIEVFTTRPDTIFGATYVVLAPEHPLLGSLLEKVTNIEEVRAYQEATSRKTERERSENKEKTGVRLAGITATNPATKEEVPVYIADYVLSSYGTGAVMAVPAHDERDFDFATKHGLPIRPVVATTVVNPHNPPVPGAPDTKRNVIHAILHNPADDTYLVGFLKDESWGDRKPVNFVIGGVDEGEDWAEAAAREIREETGYTDFELREEVPCPVNAYFHQKQKGVNRDSDIRTFVFALKSDTRTEVEAEEESKHDFKWLPKDEVAERLNIPTDELIWRYLTEGGFATTESGRLVNSGPFTGRDSEEAKWEIVEHVGGKREVQYRLRDWLVSRQRYWGCPIPVVYDPEGKAHLVPPEHLPWLLPTDVDFKPTGAAAPLASSQELRDRVTRIFGEGWTPEFDTLDTFVDSSWYFTRYLAPHDAAHFSDDGLMRKWLPVDRYSGGSEHVTLHLLYSRFFYKALYDLALVPTAEPFVERYNRGLIMGPDGQKMSKSKGNVVNPDEVVKEHGSDAVRMYLAFIGPYNEPGHYPWKPEGVASMRRFLDRVYTLREKIADMASSETAMRALARAAQKVGTDTERFKTNTAVSALMILMNELEKEENVSREAYGTLLTLLAPFAPHLAEHLFEEVMGKEGSVHQEPWPVFDQSLLAEETVTIGVQVSGKKRGEITISPDATEEEALAAALEVPKVVEFLPSGTPSRVVYVPGKILNLVA